MADHLDVLLHISDKKDRKELLAYQESVVDSLLIKIGSEDQTLQGRAIDVLSKLSCLPQMGYDVQIDRLISTDGVWVSNDKKRILEH